MPQANSATNNIKQTPQTIDSDTVDELNQYDNEIEEIHGNGATDKFSNDHPDRFEAQDRDAGGGKSPKVDDVRS